MLQYKKPPMLHKSCDNNFLNLTIRDKNIIFIIYNKNRSVRAFWVEREKIIYQMSRLWSFWEGDQFSLIFYTFFSWTNDHPCNFFLRAMRVYKAINSILRTFRSASPNSIFQLISFLRFLNFLWKDFADFCKTFVVLETWQHP